MVELESQQKCTGRDEMFWTEKEMAHSLPVVDVTVALFGGTIDRDTP